MNTRFETKKTAALGLITAIVIIAQLFIKIKFGIFSISTVLVPIVIGAAIYGPLAGAWLGFVFAMVVLLSGEAAFFLGINAFGTCVLVIAKGIACGLVPGLIYRLLIKKDFRLAAAAAGISSPIVNTGVFVIGCLIFFEWDMAYIITVFVGVNFIIELAANIILSSAIMMIIKYQKLIH